MALALQGTLPTGYIIYHLENFKFCAANLYICEKFQNGLTVIAKATYRIAMFHVGSKNIPY